MKFKNLLLAGVLALSPAVFADRGSGHGNGGDLVVCTMPDGSQTYELLDYYEGRNDHALEPKTFDGNNYIEKAESMLKDIVYSYNGLASDDLEDKALELLSKFEDEIIFTQNDLVDIPDHGEVRLASNCEIKQLVIQYADIDNDTRQYEINQNLWASLNDNEKASVVTHEIIYNLALYVGHQDSRYVRKANFALATGSGNVRSYLVAGVNLKETCDLQFDLSFKGWGKKECLKHYVENKGGVIRTPLSREVWLQKFDELWVPANEIDISTLLETVWNIIRDDSSNRRRIETGDLDYVGYFYREKLLSAIILEQGTNLRTTLEAAFSQSPDTEVRKSIFNMLVHAGDDQLSASLKDDLFHFGITHIDFLGSVSKSNGNITSCKYGENILCLNEHRGTKGALDFVARHYSNPLAKSLLEKVIQTGKFSSTGASLALIENNIFDESLHLKILDKIESELADRNDSYRPVFDESLYAFIINTNKFVKTAAIETRVREILINNLSALFSGGYFFRRSFERYQFNNSYEDFRVFGLDNILNRSVFTQIGDKLLTYTLDQNTSYTLKFFLDFLIANIDLVSGTAYEELLSRIYTRSSEHPKRRQNSAEFEFVLAKINKLSSLPNSLGNTMIESLFTNSFKREHKTETSIMVLDLMLKMDSPSEEQKLRIKVLGETDARSEIRDKAMEVYNQL